MEVVSGEQQSKLAIFEPEELIRPDINIGKWAGWLFSSPWAKDLDRPKKKHWETVIDGQAINASVTVTPAVDSIRPTMTSMRVFYGLIRLWQEAGMPADGVVNFSARMLANVIGLKWAGSDTAEKIARHIEILKTTNINWRRSFQTGSITEENNDNMSLLARTSYTNRSDMTRREAFTSMQKVRIDQDLVENMIAGKTKPFPDKVFLSIANDTVAKLYSLLDSYLSKKNNWERLGLELIQDELELAGARYEKRNIRKALLKDFVAELNGLPISSGVIYVTIEPSRAKKDDKLVVKKLPFPKARKNRLTAVNSRDDALYLVEEIISGLSDLGGVRTVNSDLLEFVARHYSADLLRRALSVVRADLRGSIKKSPIQAYLNKLHIMVHERGLQWINDCGSDCPYRDRTLPLFKGQKVQESSQ